MFIHGAWNGKLIITVRNKTCFLYFYNIHKTVYTIFILYNIYIIVSCCSINAFVYKFKLGKVCSQSILMHVNKSNLTSQTIFFVLNVLWCFEITFCLKYAWETSIPSYTDAFKCRFSHSVFILFNLLKCVISTCHCCYTHFHMQRRTRSAT